MILGGGKFLAKFDSFKSLIIHAPNVHTGGGKALLAALLSGLPGDLEVILQLDTRFSYKSDQYRIYRVSPTIVDRLNAEWRLSRLSGKDTLIICFGNLPPLFCCRGKVVVFVQNRYFVDKKPLGGFPLLVRFRLILERFWFRLRSSCVSQFVVQTPSMLTLLKERLSPKVPVKVLPLTENKIFSFKQDLQKIPENKKYDFLYVASGEPHKNHQRLLDAWCLLAKENIFPTLCLTLNDKFEQLIKLIDELKAKHHINVLNVQLSDSEQLEQLFFDSRALIFPSLFESFGIPLIEAQSIDMPILASERDFVRDLVDPVQTFDPESAISIARAVKRFLEITESRLELIDSKAFISAIMSV